MHQWNFLSSLTYAWPEASEAWIERTTSAPSPTAAATRFVEPLRTSPIAKTPGRVHSSRSGPRSAPFQCRGKSGWRLASGWGRDQVEAGGSLAWFELELDPTDHI